MSIPTADQVAHAIVAAARHYGINPIRVANHQFVANHTPGKTERSRAISYVALALADVFGNDRQAASIVGFTESRVSTMRWQLAHKALKWFDPKVLELVKAAIPDPPASPPVRPEPARAADLPVIRANAPAARNPSPAALPAPKSPPNFATIGGLGPPGRGSRDPIGEKAALRRELEAAVRNTAKMPSQN